MAIRQPFIDEDFLDLIRDHPSAATPGATGIVDEDFLDLMREQENVNTWRVWTGDASNYVDARLDLEEIWFVVGGAKVMTFDGDGVLKVADGIEERRYSAETTQSGVLALDAVTGAIAIGVQRASDGAYVRAAELSTAGRLRCGMFVESSQYPLSAAASPTFSDYVEWFDSTTSTDVSTDGQRTVARFLRTTLGGVTNAALHYNTFAGAVL